MPTYEYNCPECGTFTAVRPMAQYQQPQACPGCATSSPRITLSSPGIGGLFNSKKAAPEDCLALQSCLHNGGCRCC